ncbi:MAG: hypothetical protein EOO99_10180 [Pedobacter sp.]|nr:MAG: hypothetical protein EOO99_10180 [Pedobacter sp.]
MIKALNPKAHSLSPTTKNIVFNSICLLCLFLFAYTGFDKIITHETFEKSLMRIPVIGPYASFISWAVPLTELGVAVLLILPPTQKIGLYLFSSMMIAFTIYIGSMLMWVEKLPCNCGGVISKLSWTQHLWFNLAFITLAAIALWLKRNNH